MTFLADPFQSEGSSGLAEEREVRAEVRRIVHVEAGPKLKGVRIVLDAGHGGVDSGARATASGNPTLSMTSPCACAAFSNRERMPG